MLARNCNLRLLNNVSVSRAFGSMDVYTDYSFSANALYNTLSALSRALCLKVSTVDLVDCNAQELRDISLLY